MDPVSVLKTVWRHKWVAIPIVLVTILAAGYVYFLAPRTYEAAVSYALTPPSLPTQEERDRNPDLAKTNMDNPYLRSDNSLLVQVVIAKMTDPGYVEGLRAQGLVTDFTIAPVASGSSGLISAIATSQSAEKSIEEATLLGKEFTRTLKEVQQVNGADVNYLYEPILVRGPGPAVEQYSSRLRSVIMVGVAGGLLLLTGVSIAQSINPQGKGRRKFSTRRSPSSSGQPSDESDTSEAGEQRKVGSANIRPGGTSEELVDSAGRPIKSSYRQQDHEPVSLAE